MQEKKYWLIQIEKRINSKSAGEYFPWQYLTDMNPMDWFIAWCKTHPPTVQWTLIQYFEVTESQYNELKAII
jgi:hypothetical protein